MPETDPFFIVRAGDVWACWLDGKPAVNLGPEAGFWSAAEKLWLERRPQPAARPDDPAHAAGIAPAAAPAPVPPVEQRTTRVVERPDRHEVTIVGRLFAPGGSREVVIFDLSEQGCRVQDTGKSKAGETVSIKIGTIGPINATVRWRTGEASGLQFVDPLHPSVLEHIRRQFSLR